MHGVYLVAEGADGLLELEPGHVEVHPPGGGVHAGHAAAVQANGGPGEVAVVAGHQELELGRAVHQAEQGEGHQVHHHNTGGWMYTAVSASQQQLCALEITKYVCRQTKDSECTSIKGKKE